MCDFVEEYYVVYDERRVKTRKDRLCQACGCSIPRGTTYCRVASLYDGSWQVTIRCGACQLTHEHLRSLCGYDLWPDERLACGEEYESRHGSPPPDEIAALAFMTDTERGEILANGVQAK